MKLLPRYQNNYDNEKITTFLRVTVDRESEQILTAKEQILNKRMMISNRVVPPVPSSLSTESNPVRKGQRTIRIVQRDISIKMYNITNTASKCGNTILYQLVLGKSETSYQYLLIRQKAIAKDLFARPGTNQLHTNTVSRCLPRTKYHLRYDTQKTNRGASGKTLINIRSFLDPKKSYYYVRIRSNLFNPIRTTSDEFCKGKKRKSISVQETNKLPQP